MDENNSNKVGIFDIEYYNFRLLFSRPRIIVYFERGFQRVNNSRIFNNFIARREALK